MHTLFPKLLLLVFLLPSGCLVAQTAPNTGGRIKLTPTELKDLIHKMADLRRRRTLQQQQRQRRPRAVAPPPPARARRYRREVGIVRTAAGRIDSVATTSGAGPVDRPLSSPEYRTADRQVNGTEQSMKTTADREELAELRRRLDRQEEMLLEIREQDFTAPTTYAAPAAAPTKADTILSRITTRQSANGLSRNDLDELSREMNRMNEEVTQLRERLRYEKDRRRAERGANRTLDRNDAFARQRERPDRDRAYRDRLVPAPVVMEKNGPVRIVRDTVYVNRTLETPVLLPAKTDTVVVEKETVRDVPAKPVVVTKVQEREVIRTDTLKMKPTESIGFPAIFFANNASSLSTTHRNLMSNVVTQMDGRSAYELHLTGFSSKSGNAAYNQALSAKRAEAVRQGLIDAGWPADRIVTIPGGIDYRPATPAAARRVEVKAIPR